MEAVLALRQVHAIAPHLGIAQIIQEKAYFTFQISSEQTAPEQAADLADLADPGGVALGDDYGR